MKIEEKLTNKRISIRSYQRSDLDFVSKMWFDKENGKYLSDPEKEYIDEKFQRAVDGLENSSFGYYFVVELPDTGELVGSCSVFPDDNDKSVFDIGYCVVKSHWREGFGSDIVETLLDWIKSKGGERVTAEVAKENAASCGLLRKLGFEVIKETSFKKYNMGIEFDSFIFSKKLEKEISYNIRKINSEEVEEALALASEVFMQFEAPVYKPEGVETFKRDIVENKDFSNKCKTGEYPIYAAFDKEKIIGIIGLGAMHPDRIHINLVFTKKEYHRCGIATAIFNYMLEDVLKENPNLKEITLNSSPYGLPFYLHLGFTALSEELEKNGIRYTQMKYSVKEQV